ncbi:MAG: hypothetical protein PQJ59_15255 [Spirochaetales bacterium]|nr:hypothetical protein [Spirochaetales bacterium]
MKKSFIVGLGMLLSLSAFSLDIIDPSDMIYRDIEFWDEQGYFKQLPDIRPYSAQLILVLLDQVMEKGTADDARLAKTYYDEINQGFRAEISAQGSTYYGNDGIGDTTGSLILDIRGMLGDKLSIWGEVNANGVLFNEDVDYYMYDDDVPYGERYVVNTKEDAGSFMGIDLMGGTSSMLSYGTDKLYTNMGFYRSSFGPFQEDGVVISDEAYQQGHFELTWLDEYFTYSMLMLSLIGTDNTGEEHYGEIDGESYDDDDTNDEDDDDDTYNKFLVLHSYSWAPYKWLDVGFFESVVYGERFEPVYLLPFSYLFYSQGYSGFADNSLMGLEVTTKLPENIEFNGIVYVDDVNFNEMVKFNFDTKMKMALETGLSWSPGLSWLRRLSMDYTAVMPYMYTHYDWHSTYDANDFNADNYTHNGANLGTTLSPNSDRINLTGYYRVNDASELKLFGNWIRHGNASDGIDYDNPADEVETDGSIFDNGIDDYGELYFQDSLPFLTQDVLEKVLQFGLEFNTTVDMPFQDIERYYGMEMTVGYTFEMIWNSGRNSSNGYAPEEGDDEVNQYLSLTMRFFF